MMAGKGFGHEGSQNGSPGVSSSSQGQTVPLQQRSADHELLMKVSALQSTNGALFSVFQGLLSSKNVRVSCIFTLASWKVLVRGFQGLGPSSQ
jgi:hypothetical protein